MAIPRHRIYNRTKPVTCHCVSRCVRRTSLLAPEHRRRALRERIERLVEVFAIDVLEWALLSNHFHLVASTHPDLTSLWTDEEVARRWRTLSPDHAWRRRAGIDRSLPAQRHEVEDALRNPALIARWRSDLADLSVFHKFLKQRIARCINLEDDVTGHCFEGRFKSIVALDEEAVIAHMVYVALNPVRASLANSLQDYEHCSISQRITDLQRRIAAGEFSGEVAQAKARIRAITLRPALPCEPGADAKRATALPDGRPNPWFGGASPSILRCSAQGGLLAFLSHVDSAGRAERADGGGRIGPDAASPVQELEMILRGADEGRYRGESSSSRLADVPPVARASCDSDSGWDWLEHSTDGRDRSAAAAATRTMIDRLEEAMPRGLASPRGNFSGGAEALAHLARRTGRRFVVAVTSALDGGRRCVRAAAQPTLGEPNADRRSP